MINNFSSMKKLTSEAIHGRRLDALNQFNAFLEKNKKEIKEDKEQLRWLRGVTLELAHHLKSIADKKLISPKYWKMFHGLVWPVKEKVE